ncbi:universal stress protein [Pseudomonas sp. LFM046]|uniref:universal stress protein n=1 Tax=Pseudomonas sp. LFM046 TaxID=1608357 RepID=UPI0005CF9759|nr:universal stress protein [Pseudomonas sp. LFM046]
MSEVVASIDGSSSTPAVCDYAVWASSRLRAPLVLLHVLDRLLDWTTADISGDADLVDREQLHVEDATLDERLAQSQMILAAAKARIMSSGIDEPETRQRIGELSDTLCELDAEIRLLVMGRQGEGPGTDVGKHVERVVRTLHRPILLTPSTFTVPQNLMIAFDGSPPACRAVEMLTTNSLFLGLPVHLVMVGTATAVMRVRLNAACATLTSGGFTVTKAVLSGETEPTLNDYQVTQGIDLLVMGAYGHSRIHQLLIGSTTNTMLRTASVPLLIVR